MKFSSKIVVGLLLCSGVAIAQTPAGDSATSLNSTNTGTTIDEGAAKTTSPQMYDEATTLSETEKKMKKKQIKQNSDSGLSRQTEPLDHATPEKK